MNSCYQATPKIDVAMRLLTRLLNSASTRRPSKRCPGKASLMAARVRQQLSVLLLCLFAFYEQFTSPCTLKLIMH